MTTCISLSINTYRNFFVVLNHESIFWDCKCTLLACQLVDTRTIREGWREEEKEEVIPALKITQAKLESILDPYASEQIQCSFLKCTLCSYSCMYIHRMIHVNEKDNAVIPQLGEVYQANYYFGGNLCMQIWQVKWRSKHHQLLPNYGEVLLHRLASISILQSRDVAQTLYRGEFVLTKYFILSEIACTATEVRHYTQLSERTPEYFSTVFLVVGTLTIVSRGSR